MSPTIFTAICCTLLIAFLYAVANDDNKNPFEDEQE